MKLGFEETQAPYSSGSQNARAWTERWVKDELYCPNCGNPKLTQFPANRPVADFTCGACSEEFEVKSQRNSFGRKVVDGAFRTMCERLAANNNPSLLLLNYDLDRLAIRNALIVPKHFFVQAIIEERKPLAVTARRGGWIGCNILLNEIPDAGKIFIVRDGKPEAKQSVLAKWRRTAFLSRESIEVKGWLIEVMQCVDSIGSPEFSLEDVYRFEGKLSELYQQNQHVRQKIRQQLQRLRDNGYLDFLGHGHYRLREQN